MNVDLGLLPARGGALPGAMRVHTSPERAERSHLRDIGERAEHETQLEWVQVRPYFPGVWNEREIGEGQAWHYPANRVILLWELTLFRDGKDDPREDLLYRTLWTKVERFLTDRYPTAERLVTPAWEPVYDRTRYQSFLTGLGYQPLTEGTFAKPSVQR